MALVYLFYTKKAITIIIIFQFSDVASLASILIRILALNCDRFLEEPANKQWKD
jgi:hypothetical protein